MDDTMCSRGRSAGRPAFSHETTWAEAVVAMSEATTNFILTVGVGIMCCVRRAAAAFIRRRPSTAVDDAPPAAPARAAPHHAALTGVLS